MLIAHSLIEVGYAFHACLATQHTPYIHLFVFISINQFISLSLHCLPCFSITHKFIADKQWRVRWIILECLSSLHPHVITSLMFSTLTPFMTFAHWVRKVKMRNLILGNLIVSVQSLSFSFVYHCLHCSILSRGS